MESMTINTSSSTNSRRAIHKVTEYNSDLLVATRLYKQN